MALPSPAVADFRSSGQRGTSPRTSGSLLPENINGNDVEGATNSSRVRLVSIDEDHAQPRPFPITTKDLPPSDPRPLLRWFDQRRFKLGQDEWFQRAEAIYRQGDVAMAFHEAEEGVRAKLKVSAPRLRTVVNVSLEPTEEQVRARSESRPVRRSESDPV